jgi:hypothetical protein
VRKLYRLGITIAGKYDLGFLHSTRSRRASHTPAEWRDRLYEGAPEVVNEAGQEEK